jgi:SPP1 gp7 family putative phage head morphogenesis protein
LETATRSRRRVGGPVRPNVGNGEAYRKALDKLIDEMNASLEYWLVARWSEAPPTLAMDEFLPAMDESWIGALRRTMRELAKRWTSRFDEAAPKLATYYATRVQDRVQGRLADILKDAGMTVDFRVSPGVRTAMGAVVSENVGLIKSIATKHLADVEGIVMRSASLGRDLGVMSKELREKFDVPKKRAALIARHQNNMMTATITRVRQQEAGIEQAIWVHSHAGQYPRPEHVGWDGKSYDVSKGMWSRVDNAWVWPGTPIGCRCFCRPVMPE